jgi:protein-disulfide isomerase
MRWAGVATVLAAVVAACSTPVAAPLPLATVTPPLTPMTAPATAAPTPVPRSIVLEPRTPTGEFFKGSPNAPVTMDMFGDFQCPACGEFARTIEPTFIHTYVDTGKVGFVWHDFTWIGDESVTAAQAARCAGRQGQFWAYHDYLYAHQRGENAGHFSQANLEAFAGVLGLDTTAFNLCMQLAPDVSAIRDSLNRGLERGVEVTPSFLINGDLKVGAPPMNRLAALMDTYLARSPAP